MITSSPKNSFTIYFDGCLCNFTSIQQRIHSFIKGEQPRKLMGFVGNNRYDMPKGIAYNLINYWELVDCTGRSIGDDKAGYIEQHHSRIPERLGLDTEQ
ncbi:MAG: hypothetical protein ACJA13_000639 [Paraglaciecola sp.]|jgi:hypothetical protein